MTTAIDDQLLAMEKDIDNLQKELHRLEAMEHQRLSAAGLRLDDLKQPENIPPALSAAMEKAKAAAEAAGEDKAAQYRSGQEKPAGAAKQAGRSKMRSGLV
jgi:hypothetical protein